MKKMFLIILFLFISVNCFAGIVGEVVEIKETAKGIINVKVEYKKDGKLLKEKSYTIADSDTAIISLQNNVFPKEIEVVIEKEVSGGYDIEEIKPEPPIEKTYPIKVGDKIREAQNFIQKNKN